MKKSSSQLAKEKKHVVIVEPGEDFPSSLRHVKTAGVDRSGQTGDSDPAMVRRVVSAPRIGRERVVSPFASMSNVTEEALPHSSPAVGAPGQETGDAQEAGTSALLPASTNAHLVPGTAQKEEEVVASSVPWLAQAYEEAGLLVDELKYKKPGRKWVQPQKAAVSMCCLFLPLADFMLVHQSMSLGLFLWCPRTQARMPPASVPLFTSFVADAHVRACLCSPLHAQVACLAHGAQRHQLAKEGRHIRHGVSKVEQRALLNTRQGRGWYHDN